MIRSEGEKLVRAKLRKAAAYAKKADHYAEQAAMAADDAFRVLDYNATVGSIEEARADRIYKAHKELSNARGELGNALYKLEHPMPRSPSRDPARRRRRAR